MAADRCWLPCWILVATIIVGPTTADSQSRSAIVGGPVCAQCRIEFQVIATLGGPSDSVDLDLHSRVVRDKHGRFYTVPTRPGKVAVYEEDGRLTAVVGRLGDGPGEFRSVSSIAIGPGDSLFVFSSPRVTVFSPSGRFVRTRMIPGSFRVRSAAVLADGSMILQGLVNSAAEFGLPFHRLPPAGDVLRSFGAPADASFVWRSVYDEARRFATAGDSVLWSSKLSHYLLEEWTLDGSARRSIERKVEWFAPWTWTPGRETDVRIAAPDPHISGVTVDDSGLLWVSAQVKDQAWRQRRPSETPIGAAEYAEAVDTMIEVIDPARPALLASRRLPGVIWMIDSDLAAEYVEDSAGFTIVRVLRLRLVRE